MRRERQGKRERKGLGNMVEGTGELLLGGGEAKRVERDIRE